MAEEQQFGVSNQIVTLHLADAINKRSIMFRTSRTIKFHSFIDGFYANSIFELKQNFLLVESED